MSVLGSGELSAPAAVRARLRRGLALVRLGFGGTGLRPRTVREAKALASGRPITRSKVARMQGWFARHGPPAAESATRLRDPCSPAAVAWLLWGADPSVPYRRSGWRDPVAPWLRAASSALGLAPPRTSAADIRGHPR